MSDDAGAPPPGATDPLAIGGTPPSVHFGTEAAITRTDDLLIWNRPMTRWAWLVVQRLAADGSPRAVTRHDLSSVRVLVFDIDDRDTECAATPTCVERVVFSVAPGIAIVSASMVVKMEPGGRMLFPDRTGNARVRAIRAITTRRRDRIASVAADDESLAAVLIMDSEVRPAEADVREGERDDRPHRHDHHS